MCKNRSIYPSNGDCTAWYRRAVQQGKNPWATGLQRGTASPTGPIPRVPVGAVLYRGVPLGWGAVQYGVVWAVSNEPLSPHALAALQACLGSTRTRRVGAPGNVRGQTAKLPRGLPQRGYLELEQYRRPRLSLDGEWQLKVVVGAQIMIARITV
jgi:hypothetical protein